MHIYVYLWTCTCICVLIALNKEVDKIACITEGHI